MKTFIYFSQGEWRTFQVEELPVRPMITDIFKSDMSLAARSRIYESEIAALKAKSVKVGNPETIRDPRIMLKIFDHAVIDERDVFYEWPGTVEVKKVQHCDEYHQHTKKSCYVSEAILKLPA